MERRAIAAEDAVRAEEDESQILAWRGEDDESLPIWAMAAEVESEAADGGAETGAIGPPTGLDHVQQTPGPSAASSGILGGRFLLMSAVGRGTLATTYRAIDQDSGREVALKLFDEQPSEHADFRARLLRLAGELASFDHPNIARVLDAGLAAGRLYLVTEWVEGRPLRTLLHPRERLGVEQAIALGAQVADALAAAHQRGLTHGSVHPHNLLVDDQGQVKVSDFAVTALAASLELVPLTGLAERAAYLAPEQILGGAPTPRSDVYALGSILYEALVGLPPFGGSNFLAMAAQRLVREPNSTRLVRADVPIEVDGALLRALAANPAERFGSAAEFRRALLEHGGLSPALEAYDSLAGADRRPSRPSRHTTLELLATLTPIAATLGVGLLAFLVYTLVLTRGLSLLQYAQVPDLRGRTLSEAVQLAHTAGLEVTLERVEGTDDTPRDVIVSQAPAPGERVLRASPVKLVVSGGFKTPDLRQMSEANARLVLVRSGWKVGRVQTRAAPGVAQGTVLDQRPAPGEMVPTRGEVTLVVAGDASAGGAAVVASSGGDPWEAVDDDERTSWQPTAPVPQWIELQLGTPITLGGMELVTAQPRQEPTSHEVWVTTSAGDFFPVHTFRDVTADGHRLRARLDQPVAGVVRVRVVTVLSSGGVGWREIRLYSGPPGEGQPVGPSGGGDEAPEQGTLIPAGPKPRVGLVANTDGQGVYLRRAPGSQERIRAWRDGTRLHLLDDERTVGGARWLAVKDPAGNQGWVPAHYVHPAE